MTFTCPPFHATDFYKVDHRRQFPEGLEYVYSNFTPRTSRIASIDEIVFFGLQYFIKEYLVDGFNRDFFGKPKAEVLAQYKRRLDSSLGADAVPLDHLEALHDLGYLPLRIRALPEGSLVSLQCPCFTIENTDPRFGWLTNFIETMVSAVVWGPCTSATTAFRYRQVFDKWARLTGSPEAFVPWQGHDFSMRGMFGLEAAALSGAGHLLSFTGTDTIPAIEFLEQYYGADATKELIGGSVAASEHAVMCAGGKETELDTYSRMITKVYPKGIVSLVSDTWDFWAVVTKTIPALKDAIMAREGKLVIRPDSGDPADILCGDEASPEGTPERKGLIACLWETFGGTTTETGHRVLDSHIGAIYGDSITLDRQTDILSRLAANGFASCNVVLGIGSYTYQHVTRDTFGFAMKATWCQVNGEGREIFKQPKTDSKKNSHRGLLMVTSDATGRTQAVFPVTREQEAGTLNKLKTVFFNGFADYTTLGIIRSRVAENLTRRALV